MTPLLNRLINNLKITYSATYANKGTKTPAILAFFMVDYIDSSFFNSS
jgi:hypothetical protein